MTALWIGHTVALLLGWIFSILVPDSTLHQVVWNLGLKWEILAFGGICHTVRLLWMCELPTVLQSSNINWSLCRQLGFLSSSWNSPCLSQISHYDSCVKSLRWNQWWTQKIRTLSYITWCVKQNKYWCRGFLGMDTSCVLWMWMLSSIIEKLPEFSDCNWHGICKWFARANSWHYSDSFLWNFCWLSDDIYMYLV